MIFGLLNYGMSRKEAELKVDEVLGSLGQENLKYLVSDQGCFFSPNTKPRMSLWGMVPVKHILCILPSVRR